MLRTRSAGAAALGTLLALASPGHAACGISQIAALPVTVMGLRPIVTGKINGAEVKFLADSGAFYSMISKGVAVENKLPLKPAAYGYQISGVGGQRDIQLTTVKGFGLAGAVIPDVMFIVSDGLGGAILGQNILGIRDVDYDLANGMIRLIETKDCPRSVDLAYWAKGAPYAATGLADSRNHHTIGTVTVNNLHFLALFDTGAPVSIMSLKAAARAGVKPGGSGVEQEGSMGGVGRDSVRTWIARFDSFGVGEEQIKNIRMRIGEGIDSPEFDMILGADFFLSHHIFVANSQNRMYLTYNGGPVFNLGVPPEPPSPGPPALPAPSGTAVAASKPTGPELAGAEDYGRRAAASASRRDYGSALGDLDRAVALAPKDPALLMQRAGVRQAAGDAKGALADLDAAVALKEDNPEARLSRAMARGLGPTADRAAARADLDAAARAAGPTSELVLSIGLAYSAIEMPEEALRQFQTYLDNHKVGGGRIVALNGRCYARATLGRDLPDALKDCNEALAARREPSILDSRAFVRLKLGDIDKAIDDYDAALKLAPKLAISLYGRGVAKLRKGMKKEGEADIAAAIANDKGIQERARKVGLTPPV